MGFVPLGVVALQPEVVLLHQLLPGLGLREEVVRQTALEVEVSLDEGLPGLAAFYLFFADAQRCVDGLGSVGAEDPPPSVTMAAWSTER